MHRLFKLMFVVTLAQMLFAVGLALGAEPLAASVLTDTQAEDALGVFVKHFVMGDYWALLGPALVLAVWALRKWDQDIPKIGPQLSAFMDNPLVSYALPFVLSMGAGLGTSLSAGIPIKEALPAVFKIAMEAVTLYVGGKKAAEQYQVGKDAAAAVAAGGKAAAIEELKKP